MSGSVSGSGSETYTVGYNTAATLAPRREPLDANRPRRRLFGRRRFGNVQLQLFLLRFRQRDGDQRPIRRHGLEHPRRARQRRRVGRALTSR